MFRLVIRLLFLEALFWGAMALVALGVWSPWWAGLIGAVVLLVMGGLFGPLVAGARSRLRGVEAKTAAAMVQAFGAWCAFGFLLMALITWSYGNGMANLHDNNAYQVLGMLIFIGFMTVGIGGAIVSLARIAYVHVQATREEAQLTAQTS